MRQFILAIVCLLSLSAQAQVYSFENEKIYQGVVRTGEEICITDNPNQILSFAYLPKVGNTYLSILMFMFPSSDEEISSFMKNPKKEIHLLSVKLADGNVINLSSNHWKDGKPLTTVFVDNEGMIISMGFIDTELNDQSLELNGKTKEKEKIKWINKLKSELVHNDIKAIDIEGKYVDESNNEGKKSFHYDVTKPTTYIFKSLMFDEKGL